MKEMKGGRKISKTKDFDAGRMEKAEEEEEEEATEMKKEAKEDLDTLHTEKMKKEEGPTSEEEDGI
jgi:hypothetical protein